MSAHPGAKLLVASGTHSWCLRSTASQVLCLFEIRDFLLHFTKTCYYYNVVIWDEANAAMLASFTTPWWYVAIQSVMCHQGLNFWGWQLCCSFNTSVNLRAMSHCKGRWALFSWSYVETPEKSVHPSLLRDYGSSVRILTCTQFVWCSSCRDSDNQVSEHVCVIVSFVRPFCQENVKSGSTVWWYNSFHQNPTH